MKKLLSCLIIFIVFSSYSQKKQYKDLNILIKVEGDSLATESIDLSEVTIYPALEFSSFDDKLRYYTVKRKTLKVYPYAVLASKRLQELNRRLPLIKTRAKKKNIQKL